MRRLMLVIALAAGCAAEAPGLEHDEPSDFEPVPDDGKADGTTATFNANHIVADPLFIDRDSFTVAEVQRFLEDPPYDNASWLATYAVDGVSAAQMIVDAARAESINPLMLLARMQVEATLVSKATKPSTYLINRALGCGCPDNAECNPAFKGLANQLKCSANTLRRWYDGSLDASGEWKKGVAKRTLDPKTVTPANHATATLYAYTPWVLVGTGGNWLVWNITRKFERHAVAAGYIPAIP